MKKILSGVTMIAACVVMAGEHNVLRNSSFEQNQNGKAAVWDRAPVDTVKVAKGNYAAVLSTENNRIQQHNLRPALQAFIGGNTEMEYSILFFVDTFNSNSMFQVYMESIVDKFIVVDELRGLASGKWYRIRLRFKLPDGLKQPKVGMHIRGGGKIYVDDVFFGPVKTPVGSVPQLAGEPSPTQWRDAYKCKANLTEVPMIGNLLKNANKPGEWHFDAHDGVARYSDRENMFELSSLKDGRDPQAVFRSAVDLPAPGTKMNLSLNASTLGNPSTRFIIQVDYFKGDKLLASSQSRELSIYVGTEAVSLKSQIPEGGADSVQVSVRLLTDGRLIFNGVSLTTAAAEEAAVDEWYVKYDLYSRITDLPVRRTYELPDKPEKMTIECKPENGTLYVALNEIYGKNIKNYTFDNLKPADINILTLQLPDLPEGAYELHMKSGKLLDTYEFFRIRGPQIRGVTFDRNNWMKLNGEYIFPIALNHIPMNNDDFFRVASESGINTIAFYGEDFAENERAFEYVKKMSEKYDLAVIAWDSRINDMRRDIDLYKSLENFDDKLKTMSRFIGFLDDETAALGYPLEKTIRRCKWYFKEFPDYILWQNHAPRIVNSTAAVKEHYFPFVRHYSQPYDLLSTDIYPVPAPSIAHNQLSNRLLSCVGDYTDITCATGWNQKPVWMVLQGWGWGENVHAPVGLDKLPRPDYKELRFMAYDSILCGATGIDWHTEGGKGQGPCNEIYDAWWQDFAYVNRELAEVGKLLVGSKMSDLDVVLPPLVLGKRFKTSDNEVIIIANESDQQSELFDLRFNKKFYCVLSGKPYINGKVKFNAYDVLVLTTKPIKLERKVYTSQGIGKPLYENRNVEIPAQWVKPAAPTFNDIFTSEFTLDKVPATAKMQIHAEGHWQFFLNGRKVDGGSQRMVYEYNVAEFLKEGKNVVEVKLTSPGRNKGIAWAVTSDDKVLDATSKSTVARAEENGTDAPVRVIGPHGPNPKWKYTGKLKLSPAY